MKIVLHYGNNPIFIAGDHEKKGLGGTENFAVNTARTLVRMGHDVSFYNMHPGHEEIEGIHWCNVYEYNPKIQCDLLISFRMRDVFKSNPNAKHKVLILADTESHGLGDDIRAGLIDSVVSVSQWQYFKISKEEGLEGHPCWIFGSNGINAHEFNMIAYQKNSEKPMCIHMSTPERGLELLLMEWVLIEEKAKLFGIYPSLHLFSSFYGWGVSEEENEKMCEHTYKEIDMLIDKGYNIKNHKHANVSALRKYQLDSDFMLYPTNFNETYCISLTECMYAGAIPIVSNRGAFPERVWNLHSGFLVGEPNSDATYGHNKYLYADTVVNVMLMRESVLHIIRDNGRKMMESHDYPTVIGNLIGELERRI